MSKSKLSISIVIPNHKRKKELMNAINSCKKIVDSEIIVVENNSDVNESVKKLAGVKYFNIPKGDVSDARRLGWENASAEWIFFLDDDDTLTEEFIDFVNFKKYLDYPNRVHRFNMNKKDAEFNSAIISRGAKPRMKQSKLRKWDLIQFSTYLLKKEWIKNPSIFVNAKNQDTYFGEYMWQNYDFVLWNISSINYNFLDNDDSAIRSKWQYKDMLAWFENIKKADIPEDIKNMSFFRLNRNIYIYQLKSKNIKRDKADYKLIKKLIFNNIKSVKLRYIKGMPIFFQFSFIKYKLMSLFV